MTATNPAWGGALLTVLIGGVDVSCSVVELVVDRSKNRLWDPPDTGSCQVTLNLGPGGEPSYRGPVGASCRVKMAYGATSRWLFTGTVQRRLLDTNPRRDLLILDAFDEMEAWGRLNRRAAITDVAEGGGESVDQRITRWLDEAGSTSDRDIGSSDFTCPETLMDGNVLRQLQVAALADGGDFYVAGDGTVTFLPWNWRMADADLVAIFSDRRLHDWVPYSAAAYNDDLDEVQNTVTGTRRQTGTQTPETATNSSSVSTYGERGDALDDLELETDGQVATRVAAVVSVAAFPNPRMDSITVEPAFDPARSWPRTLPVTFGSLVAANRVWADGSSVALYGHVIGERWTINPTGAAVEYRVTGTGTWDGYRPPRPPIALERCPDGTLKVPDGYPCDTTSTVLVKDVDGTILATYPPGSLCSCGTVVIPDGGVEICLDDGTTQVCTPITDPRIDAVLWFDVLEPGPNLIERIDGDAVDTAGLAGFSGTRLDVIPGDYDAIDGSAFGGVIGQQFSDHVDAANFGGGWTIDFWLYLTTHLDGSTDLIIIDLVTIQVHLTTMYEDTGPYITQLEIWVYDDDDAAHLSGPIADVSTGDWHHWVISWNPDTVGSELSILVDGVDP